MQLLYSLAALGAAVMATAQGCTSETALIRKEWSAISDEERLNYIDALWCLRDIPSVLPSDQFPGVKDHLDDFVATHINYTTVIHRNAVFLPWHRHYIHLWEKTLREQCGYNGTVPYWDWTQNTNLTTNPLFDTTQGPNTSLSGDGAYNASEQHPIESLPRSGRGGGCVLDGPFKDWPVNMGPFSREQAYAHAVLPQNAYAYNPRCLQRNLQPAIIEHYNNASVVESILAAPSIDGFLDILEPSTGALGAHAAGHNAVGPTMADVFTSPQEPSFMLHHAMIDRLWSIWQRSGDGVSRLEALNGTAIYGNLPEAEIVTLDTVVEFGPLDGPRTIGELMDVQAGEYCYRYDE